MPLLTTGHGFHAWYLDRLPEETRAEAEFEVNAKAEKEIEVILTHLENQNEMMTEILEKLDYTAI